MHEQEHVTLHSLGRTVEFFLQPSLFIEPPRLGPQHVLKGTEHSQSRCFNGIMIPVSGCFGLCDGLFHVLRAKQHSQYYREEKRRILRTLEKVPKGRRRRRRRRRTPGERGEGEEDAEDKEDEDDDEKEEEETPVHRRFESKMAVYVQDSAMVFPEFTQSDSDSVTAGLRILVWSRLGSLMSWKINRAARLPLAYVSTFRPITEMPTGLS
jgi:hypothetical protein